MPALFCAFDNLKISLSLMNMFTLQLALLIHIISIFENILIEL